MMIAVLTCDIIGSRYYSAADRALLQESIRKHFDRTGTQFPQAGAEVLSFRVTAGDEFQFSIAEPFMAYRFLLHYRLQTSLLDMKPMPRFRCGIGIGERSVTGASSYEMDGSAYYRSRQALNAISKNTDKNKLTHFDIGNDIHNQTLHILCLLMDTMENSWSLRQRQFILLQLEGKNVLETADLLKTTHQNVSKTLRLARWNEFEASVHFIESVIKQPL